MESMQIPTKFANRVSQPAKLALTTKPVLLVIRWELIPTFTKINVYRAAQEIFVPSTSSVKIAQIFQSSCQL